MVKSGKFGENKKFKRKLDIQLFTGKDEYNLDDKGRLMLPAKYRKEINSDDISTLYLMKMREGSIWTFQLKDWKKIEEELNKLSDFKKEERMVKMVMYSNSERVEMDKHGRIMIPRRFLEECNIDKKVTVIGVGVKIVLWDPKRYEKTLNEFDKDLESLEQRIFF